jgi:hypothetical protein
MNTMSSRSSRSSVDQKLSASAVEGIAAAARGGGDAGLAQSSPEGQAGVLRSLVTVVNNRALGPAPKNRHFERVLDQLCLEAFRHRPAGNAARYIRTREGYLYLAGATDIFSELGYDHGARCSRKRVFRLAG